MTLEDTVRAIVREEIAAAHAGAAPAAPAAAPARRGRGRPVNGESAPATAAPAASPAVSAAVETDPFAAPAPAAPTATIDEVRAALTALKAATTQDNAVAVLKSAGGADNLTSLPAAKYGDVVAAVNKAIAALTAGAKAPVVEEDPFATPAVQAAIELKLEDVKAAVIAASKRTGADRAAKVVMDLGGKAQIAGGGFGPSWTALPKDKYAEAIAALNALPTTK